MPIDPLGHIAAVVHFCEQTECPSMSKLLVQTPLVHSVDVSVGVMHVAPNAPGAGPAASGADGGVLPEQASTDASTDNERPGKEESMHDQDVTMT